MLDHDELVVLATHVAARIAREATPANLKETLAEMRFLPAILRVSVANTVRMRDEKLAIALLQGAYPYR